MPAAKLGQFREFAAKKTDNPDISLDATRHLDFESMGKFGQALLAEPTVAGTLHKFHKLVATETSNIIIELNPRISGDLWFGHRVLCQADSGVWHTNLYVLSWMLQLVRLADPTWSPTEILVDIEPTRERHRSINSLGTSGHFRQSNTGFVIPRSILALPVEKKNLSSEVKDADAWPAGPSWVYADSLKQVIQSYAREGWLTIDQASEITSTSKRTLQRKLAMEQKTYSELIQESRAEIAAGLLVETDLTIAEIAHQLGYRNQGNLTRAFYRWAKVSPSEFRTVNT